MLAKLSNWVRVFAVMAVLGWPTASAEAGWWNRSSAKPTHEVAASRERDSKGDPAVGAAVIAGGVALFVFLAWLAVRAGGGNVPANDLPE
ncbi:MAG: hypothetical protein K2X82_26040 [Gemmataceae bacterium]|nr:hypothetical protein [Gemmataceae bacterium]